MRLLGEAQADQLRAADTRDGELTVTDRAACVMLWVLLRALRMASPKVGSPTTSYQC